MATVSAFPTLQSRTILNPISHKGPHRSFIVASRTLHFAASKRVKSLTLREGRHGYRLRRVRSAEEGETPQVAEEQQPVSVPVSPSDTLTMFFQAEGSMSEAAIPSVSKALEGTDGITNVKVQVLEGIATVELKKQTTIQATGVASSLIEAIQGAGFKLQTLNLSFDDEEAILV